jgi:putative tryptophan/tyrosine transport system substrate-binding protein
MLVRGANRRAFIAGLGSAAAWPVVARAQQSGKIFKIGVLSYAANEQQEAPFLAALRQGLMEHGYIEGKNIELLNRFADEHYDRFDALAKELLNAKVDVIVASIGAAAIAVKRTGTTIPVVFVGVPDPVREHLVDSLAYPGGNLTGFSIMTAELTAKRLEFLKHCLSRLSSVALLYNPNGEVARITVEETQAAARALNVDLSLAEAHAPDELKQVFVTISQGRPDAVMTAPDAMLYNERKRIAELALVHHLPIIGGGNAAESGMLMSYGPDFPDVFRRAAIYVDKIFKGAKPGDLPVEQPVKFNLIINMTTARAIGVTVPDSLQLLADKITE